MTKITADRAVKLKMSAIETTETIVKIKWLDMGFKQLSDFFNFSKLMLGVTNFILAIEYNKPMTIPITSPNQAWIEAKYTWPTAKATKNGDQQAEEAIPLNEASAADRL